MSRVLRVESSVNFVDAHIHLSDQEYLGHLEEVIREAEKSDVVAMVANSVDLKTSRDSVDLAKTYSERVFAAAGIHPLTVKDLTEEELDKTSDFISTQAEKHSLVAVGEIGLDSKYMDVWNKQVKVFDFMLRLAEKHGLPAIVHSRGAVEQVVDMLSSYKLTKVLLHWFSNPISALPKAIDRGFYVSEGAPALFSSGIREVVQKVPLNRLLTETDGPVRFSRPPFKGRMTTSAFVPVIVQSIAELRGMKVEAVASQIGQNFEDFFGIRLN